MKYWMKLWQSSYIRNGSVWLWRRICDAFFASFIWNAWQVFDKRILKSRFVQVFLDPTHLTDAYYASFFYKNTALGVRRLSFYTPRASVRWSCPALWGFLAVLLLLPNHALSGALFATIFLAMAIFFFSHHSTSRIGVVFALVILLLTLFWGILFLALPAAAAVSLGYLLLGIGFFFLVSFAVRSREDFIDSLRCLYCLLLILCGISVLGQEIVFFESGVAFGEVLILLFPFAFLAPMTFEDKPRRFLYLGILLMLTFTAVTETRSRAALVGFSAELLLLILLIDWRYLPLLLFLAPAMTETAAENIVLMWSIPKSHGNFFVNLIHAVQNFWQNGFGIERGTLLQFYSANALNAPAQGVNPLYFSLVLELGMFGLFLFLVYLLRLAHATFTSLFTAPKDLKPYFAAGFAMLLGVSVSALFEATLFSPRTLLVYWGMLGLMRAIRIIRYGIY